MAVTDRMVLLEDGPFVQMIDSLAPTARKEGAYALGENVHPQSSADGDELVGRPGTRLAGQRLVTFPNFVQAIRQFSYGSGSEQTIAVAGGELYAFNWTTGAWTAVVTTADLTAASITLSAVVLQVALLTIADQLVVSDGVNVPFRWDGTAGGGLTALTACPVLFGQPTVHQARLFGIKASDQRTMVWSEADDPTTGYDTGAFTNAWTVRQTDQHPLTRLVGTNQGLVIFRARSVTMAVGDVGTDAFQSTDTHEAIDSTRGTRSPFAVVEVGPNLAFLDADLQPHLIRPGAAGVVPIFQGFRRHLEGGSERAATDWTFAIHYTPANLLLFGVADSRASTSVGTVLVLDASTETPVPVGVWTGWNDLSGASISCMAMVLDTSNPSPVPRWLHGDYGDEGGYIYLHGNPDDAAFLTDDQMITGTAPIRHRVECQPLGFATKREKIFDRIDVSVRANTAETLLVGATTPRGTIDLSLASVVPADVSLEQHAAVGIDATGRWIAPVIEHQALGEEFGLVAVTVTAYATTDDPPVP